MLRWLCAVSAAFLLALPVAGTAFAQDGNGPGTPVCTAAAQAVSAATKIRDDAKDALAAAEAKLTNAINSAVQGDIDAARQARDLKRTALTNAENDLKAKLDAQTRACTTTPTTTPSPSPNPDHRVYSSCADYNRHGIYNIRRGDDRYRPALDRDNDGVACEPGNDDDLNLGRDRSLDGRTCDELKRDFDRSEQAVEDARTNLNRVLRDARRDVSPEGNNLSAEERRDIRTAERVVDDRTGDRDRVRDFRKDVCKDDGGDVTINVHVDPVPVEVNNDPNPLPSSSGGQVSRVPSGGVETGGSEPESNTRALGFAGLALMFPTGALVYRLIRQDA